MSCTFDKNQKLKEKNHEIHFTIYFYFNKIICLDSFFVCMAFDIPIINRHKAATINYKNGC